MTKKITCIACPRGCTLTVCFDSSEQRPLKEELIDVTGNSCPKGVAYGRQEIIRPMRTLTTTIAYRLKNNENNLNNTNTIPTRLPVKTGLEIPLSEMFKIMNEIRKISAEKPVHYGDEVGYVVTSDGSKIPIIACASLE